MLVGKLKGRSAFCFFLVDDVRFLFTISAIRTLCWASNGPSLFVEIRDSSIITLFLGSMSGTPLVGMMIVFLFLFRCVGGLEFVVVLTSFELISFSF